ncbi:MAG: hypothetical protein WA061_01195 [Microgenomates group bacterium]
MLDDIQRETDASQTEITPLRRAVEMVIPPERLKALTETAHDLIGLPSQALEAFKSRVEAQRILAENLKAANAVAAQTMEKVYDNKGLYLTVSEAHTGGGWEVRCSSNPSAANNNNQDHFRGVLHYASYSPENPYASTPDISELQKKGHLDHIEIYRQEQIPGQPTKETRMTLNNEGKGRGQKWKVEEASEGMNEPKLVKETGYFKSNGPFMDKALGREFSTKMVSKDIYTPQRHAQTPTEVQAMAQYVMAKI